MAYMLEVIIGFCKQIKFFSEVNCDLTFSGTGTSMQPYASNSSHTLMCIKSTLFAISTFVQDAMTSSYNVVTHEIHNDVHFGYFYLTIILLSVCLTLVVYTTIAFMMVWYSVSLSMLSKKGAYQSM